ncbi:MAG: ABC transporter permease [Bacillota bacterium]
MRKVLVIAAGSLTRSARDRRSLFMLLVMPLVLIAILGITLGNIMGNGTINKFRVIVVNQDQGAALPGGPGLNLGKTLAEDVFGSAEARRVMAVTAAADLAPAKAEVAAGRAVAVVYVPPAYSADVLAGRAAQIQVVTDPGQPTLAGIVTQVAGSFADQVSFSRLAVQTLDPERVRQLLAAGTGGVMAENLPRLREVSSGARAVSGLQYYAASMAVMFMIMTAFTRARDILQERQNGTLARMLSTPTSAVQVVAGQVLGSMAVLTVQFLVLMLGTRFFYGVYWGPWVPALLLGLACALASTGIATLTSAYARDPHVADMAVGLAGNVFAVLSGGMFPLYLFPPVLQVVARFIPNYWGLKGFLDQMGGVGPAAVALPLVVLAAFGLVTGLLGARRLAMREV